MTAVDLLLAALAAVAAGAINAIAGGGTLISFPVLIALGVPPLAANITNAIALCPGYFGATLAQRQNLEGQRRRATILIPTSLLGGLLGAIILVYSGERVFTALVPWMLITASVLLAIQDTVRTKVLKRSQSPGHSERTNPATVIAVFVASIYGGFFSAGMSVLILAVVGMTISDSFTRLNALKQILAFTVNIAAVLFFLGSSYVIWSATAVMALAALIGGALGGKLAARMNPAVLRWVVVAIGAAMAIVYWVKDT
jgi:uncharacterized membrane protein YfcA